MLIFFQNLSKSIITEHKVDLLVIGFTIMCVVLYIKDFTASYPSEITNFQLYAHSNVQDPIGNILEMTREETLVHISYTSTVGFRNKQQLQRFIFTNKDVQVLDICPFQIKTSIKSLPNTKMDFETFYGFQIPSSLTQKLPVLFYVNAQGNILDYHVGTIEYADLLEMTSRDK